MVPAYWKSLAHISSATKCGCPWWCALTLPPAEPGRGGGRAGSWSGTWNVEPWKPRAASYIWNKQIFLIVFFFLQQWNTGWKWYGMHKTFDFNWHLYDFHDYPSLLMLHSSLHRLLHLESPVCWGAELSHRYCQPEVNKQENIKCETSSR